MVQRLSRKELYELVWSEPMRNLAARFEISDVALRKTCVRAAIPTPKAGYWAKKEAGKSVFQEVLPERPPGLNDEVVVGRRGNYWYQTWSDEDLMAPLPPAPRFEESIEAVRERIAKAIGKLTVPREIRDCHAAIARLLRENEARKQKQLTASYPMSWNDPLFDTPFERRRLRILNAIFSATSKMNGKTTISSRDGRGVQVNFFQQHVFINLDRSKQRYSHNKSGSKPTDSTGPQMSLSIVQGYGSENERIVWRDDETGKLEGRITEIAIEIVLTAEVLHRESAFRQYQCRVERKAELEEEERKRKIKAERDEIERQKRLEQARIDRLLKDAAAFQQADTIRRYVESIRAARNTSGVALTEDVERWSKWALAEADRIDPSIGGAFLNSMPDREGGALAERAAKNLSM